MLRNEARGAAHELGLQPVQLDVLEYLGRCNRYSDTPAAVTEFLGLTKGTVSQSIQRLEEKGFLNRKPDAEDGRVSHLKLTALGRRTANSSWRHALAEAVDGVGHADLESQLEAILREIQRKNEHRSFGPCRSCRFFERRSAGTFRCGLTQERLSARDSELVCREHEHADAPERP